MGLFNQLGQAPQQNAMDPMQLLQQLQQNPAAVLQRAGLSIPAGMSSPQQIVQHLMQSGQVPQARYQQAMAMLQRMGRR